MVLPGGSSIPELLHPRRSSEPGRLQTAASTGVLGFPAQGCHTAALDKTGSSSIPACSPAPFRRLRLPRAPSHQPLTCASLGGAAGEPLRAVAGGDVGVGSHEECQAWNTAEAARGGEPQHRHHRPATATGRGPAAGSAAAPTAPLPWQHQLFPRARRRENRSPPAASTHQRPRRSGHGGLGASVVDFGPHSPASCSSAQGGCREGSQRDPESWNH